MTFNWRPVPSSSSRIAAIFLWSASVARAKSVFDFESTCSWVRGSRSPISSSVSCRAVGSIVTSWYFSSRTPSPGRLRAVPQPVRRAGRGTSSALIAFSIVGMSSGGALARMLLVWRLTAR